MAPARPPARPPGSSARRPNRGNATAPGTRGACSLPSDAPSPGRSTSCMTSRLYDVARSSSERRRVTSRRSSALTVTATRFLFVKRAGCSERAAPFCALRVARPMHTTALMRRADAPRSLSGLGGHGRGRGRERGRGRCLAGWLGCALACLRVERSRIRALLRLGEIVGQIQHLRRLVRE